MNNQTADMHMLQHYVREAKTEKPRRPDIIVEGENKEPQFKE